MNPPTQFYRIVTFLQGMLMGVAEVIPGVSGSTFALILGIYDRFILLLHTLSTGAKLCIDVLLRRKSLAEVRVFFREHAELFGFGCILVIGMIASIALLSNVMHTLLEDYPQYVAAFFFGLVFASIVVPLREMSAFRVYHLGITIFVATITFLLLGVRPSTAQADPSLLLLFFGGVVGVSGLILPGVSGSFMLLLLGLYEYVISIVKDITRLAVSWEELFKVFIFAIGLLTGFLLFVRIVKWAFASFRDSMLAGLAGLMAGSLRVLYPFFEEADEVRTVLSPAVLSDTYETGWVFFWMIFGIVLLIILMLIGKRSDSLDEI